MQYVSPSRSSRNENPKILSRMKNTLSLPALYRPHKEQIAAFLQNDKEKTKQKLKQNYFANDISHLRDLKIDPVPQEPLTESMPTSLTEILSLAYPNLSLKLPSPLLIHLSNIKKNITPKTYLEKSPILQNSAPTGRQEALNLKAWFESVSKNFFPTFSNLLASPDFLDKESVIKAWKGVYYVGFKEIQRQISIQCSERGEILEKMIKGYDEIGNFYQIKGELEMKRVKHEFDNGLMKTIEVSTENLALMQGKIESYEKENMSLRHKIAEIVIKTKELIKYLEKLRKYEDKIKGSKGKASYFAAYEVFIDEITADEAKDFNFPSISEKLKENISEKLKILHDCNQEIKNKLQTIQDIDQELNEKECKLSTLNFELEIKENVQRPRRRLESKTFTAVDSPIEKKIFSPIFKLSIEDEILHCEKFFRVLISKSKDRLIQKSKISQDHIFKSLTVIYNRAVIQLNTYSDIENQSFRFLLYKQFVKNDRKKKSLKNLKSFLSGALRFLEFKRISVFFRLLGLGDWVSLTNFSMKSFLLYLSIYLFMQNSTIGLLLFKESCSPIQYYPLSRALACLNDIKSIFPLSSFLKIELYTNSNAISDPKQINPTGIIDLELFFEYIMEEHERFINDIRKNCAEIFKITQENYMKKEDFFKILYAVNEENAKLLENSENKEMMEKIEKINLDDANEIACKLKILTTESIINIVGKVDQEIFDFSKRYFEGKEGEIQKSILGNIDKIDKMILALMIRVF